MREKAKGKGFLLGRKRLSRGRGGKGRNKFGKREEEHRSEEEHKDPNRKERCWGPAGNSAAGGKRGKE